MARDVSLPPDQGRVRTIAEAWRLGAALVGAELSSCERYRYLLWRVWGPGRVVHFVMLNPSTADDSLDDPTIRRCVRFADRWGYGGLLVTNLYALRSTDPDGLKDAPDPVGRHADEYLSQAAGAAPLTICAWGALAELGRPGRTERVLELLDCAQVQPMALGYTAAGHPRHPLYLRADSEPRPWRYRSAPPTHRRAVPHAH